MLEKDSSCGRELSRTRHTQKLVYRSGRGFYQTPHKFDMIKPDRLSQSQNRSVIKELENVGLTQIEVGARAQQRSEWKHLVAALCSKWNEEEYINK